METLTTALNLILDLNADLWRIIGLSLRVSLSATLIAATLAIPIAALISHYNFYGRRLILLLSSTMMALPPVVVGLAVYLFLSRAGPLGDWGLLFTPQAMIIAQTILIFPIILVLTFESIKPIARDYSAMFNALNTPPALCLRTLIMDARFAILTAVLAGFGRALAEVGAVIIVGGNINGLTRVMTTTIALETSKGNLSFALALGIILIGIALFINAIIHIIGAIGRRFENTRP